MEKPKNCVLVIFGASDDFTSRKLIPALFELKNQNLLPDSFMIIGTGRTKFDDFQFRDKMRNSITGDTGDKLTNNKINKSAEEEFLQSMFYLTMDTNSQNDYQLLRKRLEMLISERKGDSNYIFYLATPPSLYGIIAANIGEAGLNVQLTGYRKIIIEKPFGYDLESAVELNQKLHKVFAEDQIYRIDHYLGKETVQNLLVTRFANR